jgi:23S rRNA (cytosine1962-C5)-methyltransferase
VSDETQADDFPLLEVQRRKIANVRRGDPWIYPNAVRTGPEKPGLVRVVTENGDFIGWADYNPVAPVRARLLLRDPSWPGIDSFMLGRLQAALDRRLRLGIGFNASATRLVNGEGDGLPGLVIDVYGTAVVYDFYSLAMRQRDELIHEILGSHFCDCRHYRRMGEDAARREGCEPLESEAGMLEFAENGIAYRIPIGVTQKTGFYLDQRDNRRLMARLAAGKKVLDLFSYQGAFSLTCLGAGAASALAVDSSRTALESAMAGAERNGLNLMTCEANVFDVLADLDEYGPFDLVICDPPKLAPRKRDRKKAMGAYRHLCRGSLALLAANGFLLVSSCSQTIDGEALRNLLVQEGLRCNRALDVLAMTYQPFDHPWPVGFTTGRYLSSVLVHDRGLF